MSTDVTKAHYETLLAPIYRWMLGDYASVARASTDRFILVRSDAERILTCCLDYGIDRVAVTDIVHQKSAEGWRLTASEYPKLRLSRELVTAVIQNNGAEILRSESKAGRIAIVARKRRG
jgi:hypothetical protein